MTLHKVSRPSPNMVLQDSAGGPRIGRKHAIEDSVPRAAQSVVARCVSHGDEHGGVCEKPYDGGGEGSVGDDATSEAGSGEDVGGAAVRGDEGGDT